MNTSHRHIEKRILNFTTILDVISLDMDDAHGIYSNYREYFMCENFTILL